jgi:DNA repair exonuclease SbcCD ATPase subunit
MSVTNHATMFQEKAAAIATAMAEFRNLLTQQALVQHLEALNGTDEAEIARQQQEALSLRAKHAELRPKTEARKRLAVIELDQATVSGNTAQAQSIKRELAQAEQSLKELAAAAAVCDNRVQELASRMASRSKELFTAVYPPLRDSLVVVEKAMCSLLDDTWDDLQRFSQETGNQQWPNLMVRDSHRADLTPRDIGSEGALFTRLRYWFGGRA